MLGLAGTDVIELARTLVRIPSASGGETAVAACVADFMHAAGFDRVEVDAWGNVTGIRRGTRPGPTILFAGHWVAVTELIAAQECYAAIIASANQVPTG